MTLDAVELSRAVSHALRHEPWVYELELDADGWVDLGQLVGALVERGGRWRGVDEDSVRCMVEGAVKQRHEVAGGRIRARYGHSLPQRIAREPAEPPGRLLHGTSPQGWARVRVEGLRPMSRQYVHLSADEPTAWSVARRKSASPVLLVVDAGAAAAAGVRFYTGNDRVWLADAVPASFLREARNAGEDKAATSPGPDDDSHRHIPLPPGS